MSSNAAASLCTRVLPRIAIAILIVGAAPLAAQDDGSVTDEAEAAEEEPDATPPAPPARPMINLSVTVPKDEPDVVAQQVCEERNDASRVANEIIVCRDLGEASDGSWDKEEWEKRYAEKTKGGGTPNTFGIPNHGNPIGFGKPPPPAYIVDFDELPDTPEGSDADRIARGLPPLGGRELTEEQEKARRDAEGLRPPSGPLSAPE